MPDPDGFVSLEEAKISNRSLAAWLFSLRPDQSLCLKDPATGEPTVLVPAPHLAAQILLLSGQVDGCA